MFLLLATFNPAELKTWITELGRRSDGSLSECGIDSVIGSASGYPITPEFLGQMQQHWFEHARSELSPSL